MVDLRIHQHDADDAGIAQGPSRLQRRLGADLAQDIGRGVEQNPVDAIGADRDRGLGTRQGPHAAIAHTGAIAAVAVPLREAATGCRTENEYFHAPSLHAGLGAGMRESAKDTS